MFNFDTVLHADELGTGAHMAVGNMMHLPNVGMLVITALTSLAVKETVPPMFGLIRIPQDGRCLMHCKHLAFLDEGGQKAIFD